MAIYLSKSSRSVLVSKLLLLHVHRVNSSTLDIGEFCRSIGLALWAYGPEDILRDVATQ